MVKDWQSRYLSQDNLTAAIPYAFDVFDSDANFVLFDAIQTGSLALEEQGIAVRNLGKIGNHAGRVTVGTHEMNSKFLLAIRDLLQ